MSNFIRTGLFTEGTTDIRFLQSVVKKTLDALAFDCKGDIETDLVLINSKKTGLTFNEQALSASQNAYEIGVEILFIHTDADNETNTKALEEKIIPAKKEINNTINVCKNIVAVIPIYMTESWMLADKELLKSEIEIEDSDINLGINKGPESIKDPKSVIEKIIRKSKEAKSKRLRNRGVTISELYQIIGLKLELTELEKLNSFSEFKKDLKKVFIQLNLFSE